MSSLLGSIAIRLTNKTGSTPWKAKRHLALFLFKSKLSIPSVAFRERVHIPNNILLTQRKPCTFPGVCAMQCIAWVNLWGGKNSLGQVQGDDFKHIMIEAIADRLAEAFAEKLHEIVRKELWAYAPDEDLTGDDLLKVKYQGQCPMPESLIPPLALQEVQYLQELSVIACLSLPLPLFFLTAISKE